MWRGGAGVAGTPWAVERLDRDCDLAGRHLRGADREVGKVLSDPLRSDAIGFIGTIPVVIQGDGHGSAVIASNQVVGLESTDPADQRSREMSATAGGGAHLRSVRGGRRSSRGGHHFDDLETNKIRPLRHPPVEQRPVGTFHDLVALRQIGSDPAGHIVEPLGREAPPVAEALVDGTRVAVFEVLDDHEQHQRLPHRRGDLGDGLFTSHIIHDHGTLLPSGLRCLRRLQGKRPPRGVYMGSQSKGGWE